MDELSSFLDKTKKDIDKAIERNMPKNIGTDYIESIAGPAGYAYDPESIQKTIIDPTWDILDRGGKRWRPAFFIMIIEALGKDPKEYIDFAIIPELIHNGTLIVDDIEDDSDKRRNKPAIHRIYGNDVAINSGNALYYIPLKIIDKNKKIIGEKTALRAYEAYIHEMINLSIGQAMDIYWHKGKKETVTTDEYLQMCACKTGTLARLAARLAVILAGESENKEKILGNLAESIGIAFQIQDDILDITLTDKDREKFGKSYGNDIHEGKRTLMVIHAQNNAPKKEKDRLIEILNMHTKDENLIAEAITILEKNSSIDFAKDMARKIITDSWQKSEKELKDTPSRNTLEMFAEYLINRKI